MKNNVYKENIFATYPEMYYKSYIHEDLRESKRFERKEKKVGGGEKGRERDKSMCIV